MKISKRQSKTTECDIKKGSQHSGKLFGKQLSEAVIQESIANKGLQSPRIFIYPTTDSTNTRAKLYAEENGSSFPAVFIAEHQSAGRGRMGRRFDSERGGGLYISFLFRPEKDMTPALITLRAALITSLTVERLVGYSPKIKWVNDLISEKGKIAGILTEGKISEAGCFEYAICGMGINLYKRDFPPELSGIAATLADLSERVPDINEFASELIARFFSEDEKDAVISEYRKRCSTVGENITVRRLSGEVFQAYAVGITDEGSLKVRHEDGRLENLISAEVSVRHAAHEKESNE